MSGVVSLVLVLACASAPQRFDAASLTNPRLSPAYSQWLVGPISRMAAPEEIESYLALSDDALAERFILTFWRRRDPQPQLPGNESRALFEARAREADHRFSEAGYTGRRTDRGTVLVLHGEPTEIRFEISRLEQDPPVEAWTYPPTAPPGLDGRQPRPVYRFFKPGDLTIFYRERRQPGLQQPMA